MFPLPDDAAVDRLKMRYGGRVIEGEIQEKAQARKRYTQAKQAGRKAGLVSQERPNVFTSEVANIAPGERVSVEIEYQQTLRYDQGRFSLRFPLVVAPRYIPGVALENDQIMEFSGSGWAKNTTRVKDAARITPRVREPATGTGNPVSLRVTLAPGIPLVRVESPYHPIRQSRDEEGVYQVRLAAGEVPADRDFELFWVPRSGQIPRAALFSERWGDHDYALLMVMPPSQAGGFSAQSREVIFVLDTSGSMHGASMVQAKAALSLALQRLMPADRFNIVRFNHSAAALFDRPLAATPSNLQRALAYVQGLEAEGGTEMLPAINLALDGLEHPGLLRQVIFLTDGSVGNETELFEAIEQRLGSSRLFTLGIGSAPNGYFMTRAAAYGRGTFTYIGDIKEVEEKMTSLFTKLEHPALTDVQMHWPPDTEVQMWPDPLPDVYLGEPLVLAARMPRLQGEVSIEGVLGDAAWRRVVRLQAGGGNPGIHGLWARRKIASLMAERAPAEVRAQVLDVALEHGLVSRYTSLVAVDKTPVRPQGQSLDSKPIPVNLPAGWNADRVFGTLPQTATPGPAHLLLGLCGLIAGWWLRRRVLQRSTGQAWPGFLIASADFSRTEGRRGRSAAVLTVQRGYLDIGPRAAVLYTVRYLAQCGRACWTQRP